MQSSTVFQIFRVCNCVHNILGCPHCLWFNVSIAQSGPEEFCFSESLRLKGWDSEPGKEDQPGRWIDRKSQPPVGNALNTDPALALPIMASFRLDSTGKMFFSTSSIGPGLCAIFSLRSSASLALFSFSCLACKEGSAEVSVPGKANKIISIQQWSTYAVQQYFTSIPKGNCTEK